jgi:hypothetical protein
LNRNLHDLRVCNFELAHGCLSKRVTTQSYNAAIFMSLCLVEPISVRVLYCEVAAISV